MIAAISWVPKEVSRSIPAVVEPSEDPADGDSNMHVHHDIIIPAFPLCTSWLDCPIKDGEKALELGLVEFWNFFVHGARYQTCCLAIPLYIGIDFSCCSRGFLVISIFLSLHLILKGLSSAAVRWVWVCASDSCCCSGFTNSGADLIGVLGYGFVGSVLMTRSGRSFGRYKGLPRDSAQVMFFFSGAGFTGIVGYLPPILVCGTAITVG
ncbi:hypothetical protein LOK49_LG15G02324 [Camellia lanceoleosa]|uniref:Uncharacterized protein n=1 Tax=Camellia lanceoleosa TaxID=1840588 RepID=A0ACC0F5H3_9ERIC|nr:hypothetical protein LOK49_LG15G02324 [Camellia lanceoleosa]